MEESQTEGTQQGSTNLPSEFVKVQVDHQNPRNTKVRRSIVPVEQWIRSTYYLGREANYIRPFWRERIIAYFNGDKKAFIFSGSSRAGKSYVTAIIIIRYIYEMYCYESFPTLFGLSPTTLPKIFWFSFSRSKADSTGIDRLIRIIDGIPFFNDSAERKRRPVSTMVSFPWVEVFSGVNVNHSTGEDILGAIIDEANVRHVAKSKELEEAQSLFMELRMRSATTFAWKGTWGGFAGIISTAATTSSFVDSELAKAKASGDMFTVEAAVYDVYPEGYSDEKFDVYAGDGDVSPFIVDEISSETSAYIAQNYGMTPKQYISQFPSNVVHPPVSLKHFYEEDIDYALSNLSGRATVASSNFFNKTTVLKGMFNPDVPAMVSRDSSVSKFPLIGIYDTEDLVSEISEDAIFKYYDGENVYGHNDISKKNDHTGVAFLYYSQNLHRIMPVFCSALYYNRNIADNEIDQVKVFSILPALLKLGVNVKYVSADFYASDYYIQQAKLLLGADHAGRLSVDETPAAYLSLLNFARKNMISMSTDEELLYELSHLQYDKMSGKVDHPYNPDSTNPVFFKDEADAVAGATFHILSREDVSPEEKIVSDEVDKARSKMSPDDTDSDDKLFESALEDKDDFYSGALEESSAQSKSVKQEISPDDILSKEELAIIQR